MRRPGRPHSGTAGPEHFFDLADGCGDDARPLAQQIGDLLARDTQHERELLVHLPFALAQHVLVGGGERFALRRALLLFAGEAPDQAQ